MEKLEILILLFFVYSFAGWAMESIGGIFVVKKFVNRGFLIGPYCPVYGAGVVLITVLLGRYTSEHIVFLILAMVICGVLEYATSYFMEKWFNARWWDYSNRKFNINGRICLENVFIFGVAAAVIIYGTNPVLEGLFLKISDNTRHIITGTLSIGFIIDTIFSFNIIAKFKDEVTKEARDNTEEISEMVMDKAEDIIMSAESKTLEISRDVRYIGLKIQRKVKYTGKKFTTEGDKFVRELANKANNQRTMFAERIKQGRDDVTNIIKQGRDEFTNKIKHSREDVTIRINALIEKFKIKSILNKRLIDAFPHLQINFKRVRKSEENKK